MKNTSGKLASHKTMRNNNVAEKRPNHSSTRTTKQNLKGSPCPVKGIPCVIRVREQTPRRLSVEQSINNTIVVMMPNMNVKSLSTSSLQHV